MLPKGFIMDTHCKVPSDNAFTTQVFAWFHAYLTSSNGLSTAENQKSHRLTSQALKIRVMAMAWLKLRLTMTSKHRQHHKRPCDVCS